MQVFRALSLGKLRTWALARLATTGILHKRDTHEENIYLLISNNVGHLWTPRALAARTVAK